MLRHAKAGLAGSEVMRYTANRDAGTRMYPVCKPLVTACRNGWGYACLRGIEMDLQLPGVDL